MLARERLKQLLFQALIEKILEDYLPECNHLIKLIPRE